jgi:ribosomal protein L40E
MMEPIKIFYCYAPQDRKLRDDLEKQLMSLKRLGKITLRLNREILAGTNWSHVEDGRFQAADLILLLISPDFIHSDYHYGIEMHHALEKHEAENVWVIPIILRPTALWEKTPIGKLQALPRDGIAITTRRNRETAFVDVVKEISGVVAIILTRKQKQTLAIKGIDGTFPKFTQVIGPQCISCGARNPLGITTCENCGDVLLERTEITVFDSQQKTAQNAAPFCDNCGAENPSSARFCQFCGSDRFWQGPPY